ncbi:14935_t:CDS:1, partial [Dentiscutata heterogama]
ANNQVMDDIVIKIESDTDKDNKIPINNISTDIKLEEHKIALLECKIKLRKEAAEVEAIKLQNQQLKRNMSLV